MANPRQSRGLFRPNQLHPAQFDHPPDERRSAWMPTREELRRDPVVQNAWLKTIAASLSAVAITGTSVVANPALMAARRPAPKAADNSAPSAVTPLQTPAGTDDDASSFKNPFKFISESFGKRQSQNEIAPPANSHHSLATASTPVGQPTPEQFIAAAQQSESQGDIQRAHDNFQHALNSWPGHVEVLRAAARMEDRLGNLPVAENLYGQAVSSNPGHAGALNDLGLCLARQGKLEASVQMIEQAIQLQPQKSLYRNNAATVLVEMRQDQRALAHLATVHGAADANYNFGQLLVQRGRAADATQYFQAAVDQNPQMTHAQVALDKLRGEEVPATATYTPAVAPAPQVPVAQPAATPSASPEAGPQMINAETRPGYRPSPTSAPPTRYLPPVAQRPENGVQQR
jgi:Tfp pilus assembly protein PilF